MINPLQNTAIFGVPNELQERMLFQNAVRDLRHGNGLARQYVKNASASTLPRQTRSNTSDEEENAHFSLDGESYEAVARQVGEELSRERQASPDSSPSEFLSARMKEKFLHPEGEKTLASGDYLVGHFFQRSHTGGDSLRLNIKA